MARNAIECDFRSSKIATGGHFAKKINIYIKVAYRSEIARNAIETEFQLSKMATRLLVWWKPCIEMLVL